MESRHYFEWLKSNSKLNLYEALLDTIEDFRDMELNIKAQKEIEQLKERYKLEKMEENRFELWNDDLDDEKLRT